MITIRFSGRVPSPQEISIGMETDSNAEKIAFVLPKIADGQIATLQMILPDGVPDALEIVQGEVTIPARIMEVQGTAQAWVEILADNVMAWHSGMITMGIGALPEISDRTEQQYPTAFQAAIAATLGNKQAAETAAQEAEIAAAIAKSAQGQITVEINGDGDLIVSYVDTDGETHDVNLGPVSAYSVAKKYGYQGTEEEWEQNVANVGVNAAAAEESAEDAADSAEAAATAKTAAQAAQEAAETAAERDVTAWLDEHAQTAQIAVIDDTLSIEGAAAEAKVTGNELNSLKSAIDQNSEIIDSITTATLEEQTGTKTTNKFINYNAVVADANANYYIYTFPVSAGDRFIINGAAGSGGYLYIFTDSNNNTIGESEKNTGSTIQSYSNISAVAPENAAYLIVGSNISSGITQVLVRKITGYDVNGIEELNARVDAIEEIFTDVTETASASSSDWTEHDGEYMFTSGSTTTGTGWRYIEYPIPSNATALIVKAKAGQSARLWILKDANNTVLGYSADSSSASVKTETVNISNYTGATKLFVNDKDSDDLSIQYQYTAKKVSGDDIEWDGATIDEVLASNPLWGKILCCAGDSITYGADMDAEGITNTSNITVYQSDASGNFTQTQTGFLKTWNWQIASRNKMTLYNAGVSGSTMQGLSDHAGFSLANGRYTKLPDNLDYLLIWFGWNDNAYGTLGTINDNTNASYYGGYNIVLPYLINKYPYAKIGLIVPFGSSAGHREAVRLLGNKWGCAVWDNYQGGTPLYFGKEDSVGVDATIVTANKAKFQANGAHPNFKGHRQLADMIEEWLKGM